MSTHGHATYKHAPLALATVEVRFPDEIGPTVSPRVLRAFREVLGSDWITDQIRQQASFTINVGVPTQPQPGFVPAPGVASQVTVPRFTLRDRTMAVMVGGGSLTIETTRYEGWPAFHAIVERAIDATSKTIQPEGVTRVGARYVNEIRVPAEVHEPIEWADWLSAGLLPPAVDAMGRRGWQPLTWNGVAQYQLEKERYLVIRYGPQPANPGFVVNPHGLLQRPGPVPNGPFFLLDFDAFWQPAAVPPWDRNELLQVCDDLHTPIEMAFDEMVTPRLISHVFDGEEAGDV